MPNEASVESQVASILRESEIHDFLKGKDESHQDTFKDFLLEVVSSRNSYFNPIIKNLFNPKGCPETWISEVRQNARTYLNRPWLHNPWLTRYMIKELATCQGEGLAYQFYRGIYPEYSIRNSLDEPYNRIVPPVIGIVYFLLLVSLLYYLLNHEQIGWAALVGTYIVYHYVLKIWQSFSRAKARRKLHEHVQLFSIVLHEIVSDAYDTDTIARRLESFESKGLFAFSLLFPLLKLRKNEIAKLSSSDTNQNSAI